MRTIALVAGMLVLVAPALAHTGHDTHTTAASTGASALANATAADIIDQPDIVVETYNSNVDQLPSLVKSLVAGERINVHVEQGQNETVIGVAMDGARIARVEDGGVDDPTVSFHTDADTIDTILTAEKPGKRAVEAFNGPGITYETHGLGTTIKFAVVSTVSAVLGALL
ncbi:MAG: hypothetical protein SVU88_03580 [Candidatus Nanohaloarchaea archaeon]|nr:hypothetical protein [Candidatus Nanohaloarchaea archaeon]